MKYNLMISLLNIAENGRKLSALFIVRDKLFMRDFELLFGEKWKVWIF
jgi:hypothetical protein